VVDPAYDGIINVTIIATGFSQSYEEQLWNGRAASAGGSAGRKGDASTQVGMKTGRRKRWIHLPDGVVINKPFACLVVACCSWLL
jgi:hypothetical protein